MDKPLYAFAFVEQSCKQDKVVPVLMGPAVQREARPRTDHSQVLVSILSVGRPRVRAVRDRA